MPEFLDHQDNAPLELVLPEMDTKRDFDLWLLQDSLAKTPWERMQANDDALNFAESLQAAVKNRHAKP